MRSALVLASLLLGGCCFTDVGCESGIVVSGIEPTFDEIEVCANDECGEPFPPDGFAMIGDSLGASLEPAYGPDTLVVRPFSTDALQDGDRLEVRLFVAGDMTAERELVVESYQVLRPNGDLCEPVCLSASFTW